MTFLKHYFARPSVLMILLFGAGLVYAFAFDGLNIETVTEAEVEAWLEKASGQENYNKNCNNNACVTSWAGCSGRPGNECEDCDFNKDDIANCAIKKGKSKCGHTHSGCGMSSDPKCPFNSGGSNKYCANGGNSCPDNCNRQ